ncbi:hypothetical protein HRbin40_01424 [bacterium HR40]|nr:hypothetical protein HRbin40_01424 [bacterium HR40]
MAYWIFKTEPEDYSWEALLRDGRTDWDGVRNHQAARNMRAMRVGDLAFFYRSVKDPALVGVVRVVREAWPDPDDPRFVRVDIEPVRTLPRAVPLAAIRAEPALADLALVRQPRLSVLPVCPDHWRLLCRMAGLHEDLG